MAASIKPLESEKNQSREKDEQGLNRASEERAINHELSDQKINPVTTSPISERAQTVKASAQEPDIEQRIGRILRDQDAPDKEI